MPVSKYDVDVDLSHPQNSSHWHVSDLVGSAKAVLDVGCSTGYLSEAISGNGNDVVGLESDPASADVARSKIGTVELADLENVDLVELFGTESFDVVIFADVLEHLRDPAPVLRATRKLLRPGGYVVISLPNIAHGDVRLALLDGKFNYTATGILDNTHTKFFTRDNLVAFLHECGFVVGELRRTHAPLFATEQAQDPDEYSAEIVERVLRDPDATTYQFVVRAVPDDANAVVAGHAERLYAAEVESEQARDHAARLQGHVTHLEGIVSRSEQESEQVRDRLSAAEAQIASLAQEREALMQRVHSQQASDRPSALARTRNRIARVVRARETTVTDTGTVVLSTRRLDGATEW